MHTSTLEILPGNATAQPIRNDELRLGIRLYRDDEVFGVDVDDTHDMWNILVFMSGAYTPDMGYKESGVYVAPVLDLQDGTPLGGHFEGCLLSIPVTLWRIFDIYNLERSFMSFDFRPYVELDEKEARSLYRLMNLLETPLSRGDIPHNDREIISLCRAIIATINRCFGSQGESPEDSSDVNATENDYVHQFLQLVKTNCLKEKKLDFYAGQLCITPKYLSILISKYTGKKAGKWISDSIIEAANKLLCSTSSQIKDIAVTVGFANSSDFCRYYRTNTGITPMQYRRDCMRQNLL